MLRILYKQQGIFKEKVNKKDILRIRKRAEISWTHYEEGMLEEFYAPTTYQRQMNRERQWITYLTTLCEWMAERRVGEITKR